jgi:hypothetical protein
MNIVTIVHHTPEQVRALLTEAVTISGEIAAPVELRSALFTKAVDLLAQKTLIPQQQQQVHLPAMAIPQNRRQ